MQAEFHVSCEISDNSHQNPNCCYPEDSTIHKKVFCGLFLGFVHCLEFERTPYFHNFWFLCQVKICGGTNLAH
jgi:hypothetical protein